MTDDVFILDAYDNVYVWIGEDARPEEKDMAMDAALVSIQCVVKVLVPKKNQTI